MGKMRENLHIQVGDDDLAEDADEQPEVKVVVLRHLVRVERVVAEHVGQGARHEVHTVADQKGFLDRVHARIAIDFAELRQDELPVHHDVDDQSKLIHHVKGEEKGHDLPMVKVVLESEAGLKREVEIADDELDFVLDALDDFEHPSGALLVIGRRRGLSR